MSRRRPTRLQVESLEARNLFAVLASFSQIEDLADAPTLVVNGTDGNDTIAVDLNKSGQLTVKINNVLAGTYAANAASRLVVAGNDGNDRITIGKKVGLEAVLRGGVGNDTIVAGGGQAFVYGGEGNDRLTAGARGALLFGNGGNDTLTGGAANDVIHGGDGIDTINGGKGRNALLGGTGADKLKSAKTDQVRHDPTSLLASQSYAQPYSIFHWSQGIADQVSESLDSLWSDVVDTGKFLYDLYGDYETAKGVWDIAHGISPDPLWWGETILLGREIPFTDIGVPGLLTPTELADGTLSGNRPQPTPSPWAYFESTLPNPSTPSNPWYLYEELFNADSSSYFYSGNQYSSSSGGHLIMDDSAPKANWSDFANWSGNQYYNPDPVFEDFFSPLPGLMSPTPLSWDYLSDDSSWWSFSNPASSQNAYDDFFSNYGSSGYGSPSNDVYGPTTNYGYDPYSYGGSTYDPSGYSGYGNYSGYGYDPFGSSSYGYDPYGYSGYGSYGGSTGYGYGYDPYGYGNYGSSYSTYGSSSYSGYGSTYNTAIDPYSGTFTPGFFDNLWSNSYGSGSGGYGSSYGSTYGSLYEQIWNSYLPDGSYLGTYDDTRYYTGGYRIRVVDNSNLYQNSSYSFDDNAGYGSSGYGSSGYGSGSSDPYAAYGGQSAYYDYLMKSLQNAQNAYSQRYK